jgi:c-di-GMP-binding flagellar brake protein YcgR
MERRKEARVEMKQQVTVTVLGEPDSPPFQALAVEMSGTGMGILSPLAVPYQAAVKVQLADLLLLGEVVRVQVSDGGHMLALKLRHSLDVAGDLNRLNDALHMEASRESIHEIGRASEPYVRLR